LLKLPMRLLNAALELSILRLESRVIEIRDRLSSFYQGVQLHITSLYLSCCCCLINSQFSSWANYCRSFKISSIFEYGGASDRSAKYFKYAGTTLGCSTSNVRPKLMGLPWM